MMILSRRRALMALSALIGAVIATPVLAREALQELMADLMATEPQEADWLHLELPSVADNASGVSVGITVQPPDGRRCEEILLVAEKNPRPAVCRMVFTAAAVPEVETRIRLAETQELTLLARLDDGSIFKTSASITVVGGGCGMLMEEPV